MDNFWWSHWFIVDRKYEHCTGWQQETLSDIRGSDSSNKGHVDDIRSFRFRWGKSKYKLFIYLLLLLNSR